MDYLIRFVQIHETFRRPETDSLAEMAGVKIEWLSYSEDSPFAIIRFNGASDPTAAARALLSRSILGVAIYELWGSGVDYESLHNDIRDRTQPLWDQYSRGTFRFDMDSFYGSRPASEQRKIIETFSYMAFTGQIRMRQPDNQFRIFEEYELDGPIPHHLHFGRLVAESDRKAMNKYSLKTRNYIATTSMDAELSLVTANLAQAAPGTLAYDPFMGTGSFPVACAHFGAAVFGSDLDGRSIRGKGGRNVSSNFDQYGTAAQYLGGLVADLTNTPLREKRFLNSIVCDPPYGVREGLKVLGSTRVALKEVVYLADGKPAHLQANYVPPKRPYSFMRLLDDILDFSADRLADDGRLCMWMPVAGLIEGEDPAAEEDAVPDTEYTIPRHPGLELVSLCKQDFNKWSRRLLTYRRKADAAVDQEQLLAYKAQRLVIAEGSQNDLKARADDLNAFRRKYFQGFKEQATGV
ncbi:hypothetical protein LTR36_001101 [Oleoguttula mirabilis]|uniref:tRNA (guanine(10)-N(2))-methyltransferase n=1 Tax=Oleoguttula mirabilis TaxID=1507867 RepID=A0AAV9JR38_9PEZI|nr:hypothetical protein LTR36_001101 [Oleoguttula mirabilis]